jgi:hypothetical protein
MLACLLQQVPSVLQLHLPEAIEQFAIKLVHHATEPEPVLAACLHSALGLVMPLPLAGPWLRSVATWHRAESQSGGQPSGIWCASKDLVAKYGLPAGSGAMVRTRTGQGGG